MSSSSFHKAKFFVTKLLDLKDFVGDCFIGRKYVIHQCLTRELGSSDRNIYDWLFHQGQSIALCLKKVSLFVFVD
jgi:hypothetical protein